MDTLVVSRKDATRALVRRALGPSYAVEEAGDGLEALRRARAEGYDLVIADETTEPYGAFGLTRELKLLPEAPAVVILLERDQDVWLARWAGADRWLFQPVNAFALAAMLDELASEQRPNADNGDAGEPASERRPNAANGGAVEPVAG